MAINFTPLQEKKKIRFSPTLSPVKDKTPNYLQTLMPSAEASQIPKTLTDSEMFGDKPMGIRDVGKGVLGAAKIGTQAYLEEAPQALNWMFRTWLPSKLAGYDLSPEEQLEAVEMAEKSWQPNLNEALKLKIQQGKRPEEILERNQQALELGMAGFDEETMGEAAVRGFTSQVGGEILEAGMKPSTWLTWYGLQKAVPYLGKKVMDKLPPKWKDVLTKDLFNRADVELNKAYKLIGGNNKESFAGLQHKYKIAAFKSSPHKGGSIEAVKRVNVAWDLIKKSRLVSLPDFAKAFQSKYPQLTKMYAGLPVSKEGLISAIRSIDPAQTAVSLGALSIPNLQGILSKLKPQQPLIEEAKKYKSAEEFVEKNLWKENESPYPLEDISLWYGDANYKQAGGILRSMTPQEFLDAAAPLKIDDIARENINDLKTHIKAGNKLDPLSLYNLDKQTGARSSDGRHRAIVAKELGMKTVPVVDFTSQLTDIYNKPQAPIQKQPLIEEAKKYKSAEEFVESKRKEFELEQGREASSDKVLNDWFKAKQRQKVMGVGAERAGDLPKLTQMPKGKLENIEFTKEGDVKLYRGTPKNIKDKKLRYGDFMSPKKAKAQFYGEVTEHIVSPEDIAYLSKDELVYAKESEKIAEPTTYSITDIYNKSQAPIQKEAKVEPPIQTAAIQPQATTEQKAQAHIIAKDKQLISVNNKPKPQYRRLAEAMTGKKSVKDMTQQEADYFISALGKLSEPTYKGDKLVPPSIPKKTDVTTQGFFERKFERPTPAKLATSQSRYAELLGVKQLTAPYEKAKMSMDIEYGKTSNQIDKVVKKLRSFRTISPENMSILLNTNEEAPLELQEKERDVFDYFRYLTRNILDRENKVRVSLDLEPIKYKKAYFRHIADVMSQEIIEGKYPLPEGLKYWSEQLVGKRVYNPMSMKRSLEDDLLEHFSKDLAYTMKSMLWTGLKEIHLSQPKQFFNKLLGTLAKDKSVYNNLTPAEQKIYDAQMTMPASTKKWLIDYVNIVLSGRQTGADEGVNLWITESHIKTLANKALVPFGKHISQRPMTNMITNFSRLPIYGVMGGINPRQLMRNKMQTLQNMALYGIMNTIKGYFPTKSFPTLERLKTDSLFKKSYSSFEDMPAELKSRIEKIGLAPYQWSALSNVSQAMNTAYHWTANKIQNPKNKHLGWADPERTYKENKNFFYPSEEAKLSKEMEYGTHTTQYQYIGMGMPEVFRYKSLSGLTRLQSWWMNHWFVFHREAATRAFTGHTGYDEKVKITVNDRFNYLKYLLIGGVILNTLGYGRSYLIGTAPTGLPPTAQLVLGVYTLLTNLGDTPWEKRKRTQAVYQIKNASKTFIPGYLNIKDTLALASGEKDWTEYLFYKKSGDKKTSSSNTVNFKPVVPKPIRFKPIKPQIIKPLR